MSSLYAGPTAEAGADRDTRRTNVNKAAVEAVAAWGTTMPAKRTAKPTTPMATTAATLSLETTVPSTIKKPLTT